MVTRRSLLQLAAGILPAAAFLQRWLDPLEDWNRRWYGFKAFWMGRHFPPEKKQSLRYGSLPPRIIQEHILYLWGEGFITRAQGIDMAREAGVLYE